MEQLIPLVPLNNSWNLRKFYMQLFVIVAWSSDYKDKFCLGWEAKNLAWATQSQSSDAFKKPDSFLSLNLKIRLIADKSFHYVM